jgi:hypothetical protein
MHGYSIDLIRLKKDNSEITFFYADWSYITRTQRPLQNLETHRFIIIFLENSKSEKKIKKIYLSLFVYSWLKSEPLIFFPPLIRPPFWSWSLSWRSDQTPPPKIPPTNLRPLATVDHPPSHPRSLLLLLFLLTQHPLLRG